MRLETGFKLTDDWAIPNDWCTKPLEELCGVGGLVRGPFGGALKKEFFVERGFKVYEQKNAIYRDTELGSYFVDEDRYRELRRFEVRAGDFIVSCSGTIGRIFQIPEDAPPGIINQALLRIRIDRQVIDEAFFYYVFDWSQFQQRIIDNTQGGAMQNLVGMDVFRKVALPVPPLDEQKAIANLLGDIDTLIKKVYELINKKRSIVLGAIQQLVTANIRLPGFAGEWELKSLGEIFDISTGTSKSRFIKESGKYLIADMGAVSRNGKLIANKQTDYASDFLSSGDLVMPKDDIGGGNIIGKVAFIDSDQKFILGDHVFLLRNREGNALYLHYAINSHQINCQLRRKASGSAQLGLNRRSVEEQELILPEFAEQEAIAKVLSDMDGELAVLEERLEKTNNMKQGLMHELLSGKTRLI
jgi:type I restriction enzyme S subunit